MPNNAGNKTALVLSGGGAYGAYEVGVIQALFEGISPSTAGERLDPDIFTGTSVGSYNAAILAMNQGGAYDAAKQLLAIWRDRVADNGDGRGNGVYRIRGNPFDYTDLLVPGSPLKQLVRLIGDTASLGRSAAPRVLNLLSPHERLLERMQDLVDISAFLNVEPFRRLLEDTIVPSAIRTSGKVLKVFATSLLAGDSQGFDFPRISDEETWTAIGASAAIPALFPPVDFDGEVFIDGGVVLNTPINPAVESEATEIHVVSLNPNLMQMPEHHIDNTLDTFNRVYAAMLVSRVDEDVASAAWINQGIEVLERIEAGEDVNAETMQRFVRVARVIYDKLRQEGKLPNKLTVHRYYPRADLGDMLGMLNFERAAIDRMVREGYADTRVHNCAANGCLIPAVVPRTLSDDARAASNAP